MTVSFAAGRRRRRLAGAPDEPEPLRVRRLLAISAAAALLAAVAVQASAAAAAKAGSPSSAPSTTTTRPLTLAAWKAQYESAIGEIADDVLVVVDTGVANAKHPTKKKVEATISDCDKWHSDAATIPAEVPPIPLASAEKAWKRLIAASLSASSDCTGALGSGSEAGVKAFHEQLAIVDGAERQLVSEVGSPTKA